MTLSRLAAPVLLLLAGCARDPGNCCDEFGSADDRGVYCNAHKEGILQFVRGGATPAERKGRLDWFKGVLKAVEPMKSSDEIHAHLAQFETSRPEFWTPYEKHHFWAARDTNLSPVRWGDLMKCGFRHAVHVLESELR